MKKIILILVMLVPFYIYGQTNVIEPELVSNQVITNILPYDFSKHNGKVYVNAEDEEHGLELWVFDEEINSLQMVKDINPNGDSDPIVVNTELEDVVLFVAKDENGTGLWATDGTEEGTKLLKYFQFYLSDRNGVISKSENFIKYKGEVYFSASNPGMFEFKYWKTDGTPEGTINLKELNIQNYYGLNNFHLLNDKLFFEIIYGKNNTPEVWSTDGTEENTIKLLDVAEVVPGSYAYSLNDIQKHIFLIDTTNQKNVLWATDGSTEGTVPLTNNLDEFELDLSSFALLGDKFYFSGRFSNGELALFVSDGSQDGTKKLKTLSMNSTSGLRLLTLYNKEAANLYFSVIEDGNHWLWTSAGTTESTMKLTQSLKDIYSRMSVENSSMTYFVATDDEHGDELWVSRGTEESTYLVKDLIEGPVGSDLWFASIIVDGKVLFFFEDENEETATWITDGTESGTFILNLDLMDITHMSFYDNLYGNMLLFVEESKADTVRMWQTDMTKEGTSIIMPNDPNYSYYIYSYPFFQVELKNYVYFFAYHESKPQLYRIPNTITSVEESEQTELMTVYPNPAKDYIQLELTKPMQLSIINSTGAKVKDFGVVADGKLNVAELHSGVYFVVDKQGKNIAKFVKE